MTLDTNGIVENIIPLHRGRPRKGMNALRLVEGYWSALCKKGDLPQRSDVHPRALNDVLAHVFILERIAPGLARFRVAGRQLSKLAGVEVRGMPISSFFHTSRRQDICSALDTCFEGPSIVEASLTARSVKRGPDVEGRIILLPLRSDDGTVSRCLGAVQMSDRLVSDAYRLSLGPCDVKPAIQKLRPTKLLPRSTAKSLPRVHRQRHLELVYSADHVRTF